MKLHKNMKEGVWSGLMSHDREQYQEVASMGIELRVA
jgi:hypothetical protein